MISARRHAVLVATLLVLGVSGCSSSSDGDGNGNGKTTSTQGMLTKSDLPFDATSVNTIDRPHVMTQISSSCIGIEQGVLYDAKWTVKAREFFDDADWTVVSAVYTPPSKGADDGLAKVRTKGEDCIKQETTATVVPLDVGHGAWAYEVQTKAGDFDSARAYVPLGSGSLAQVSIYKMAKGQDPKSVLTDLVDKVA